jgi:uncharacterized repeat protein (TIGR02543 family)
MKKSFFTTLIFLWSAVFLSLQAQNCSAGAVPDVNWSGCNKTNANLSGANLSYANLSGANLTNANLSNVNMTETNLTGANLTAVDLTDAMLTNTILTGVLSGGITGTPQVLNVIGWQLINGYLIGPGANLAGANLIYANLIGANLSGADLSGADLYGVNLSGANLSGANLFGANLSGANLFQTNLNDANLSDANLSGATVDQTFLQGANLTSANLTGANMGGANLDNADLSNADLTGANLLSASLPGANLSGANLSSTQLSGTNMSGAILTGAILTGAQITNSNLSGANLSGANLSGLGTYDVYASLYNSDLTGAILTGADLTNMDLRNINISGADLTGAILNGVGSGGITGTPYALPADWQLINGYLVGPLTVTFDANGGTTPSPETITVLYNATYGTLATASRLCYTFNGWFTASNGGTEITSSSTVGITSNQTLYAQWTAATSNSTETIVACGSYEWHGTTYTSSNNTATWTGTNAAGCDSIVTLDLTINTLPTITASSNTPVCEGGALNLTSTGVVTQPVDVNYSVESIAYAPVTPATAASAGPAGDDRLSDVPIGFNFNYYGTTYTNLFISTNGYISFYPSNWFISQALPDANYPNAVIALAWVDLDTQNGGTIDYFNLTSPNRFVVRFNNVATIIAGSGTVSGEIILYDSGIIEIHNTAITITNNIAPRTQGIENSTGTLATTVAGRNFTKWNATADAFRFSPPVTTGAYAWTGPHAFSVQNPSIASASTTDSGTYTVTFTDPFGCSASTTVDAVVNPASSSTETIVACGSYEWHGNTYTSSNNTATWTGTNAAGCDSIVSLDLTINQPSYTTETIVACGSYEWHGTTYTSSNNTATWTGQNAAGCDSTVTLNLTIKSAPTASITGNTTFCAGGNTVLTANATSGGGGSVMATEAGAGHSLFLKNDGTVWATGNNQYGQLGDGTNVDKNTPVQLSGLNGITAMAGGALHSLFLQNDGTVWATGNNNYGQLGDGTYVSKNTPVQVSGLSGITAITVRAAHSLFLKSDGTVWATGYNEFGQLGDGTYENKNTPVQVSGLSDFTSIAAGANHSLFLMNDGTLWATGFNNFGQLGDGTYELKNTPVQVSGLSGTSAITAGYNHSLFLKNDGTVWATGWNNYGQLGDGTYENKNTPVTVSGFDVTITSYQWKLNGSDIAGATNATYTATTEGNYTVEVTNSNGCSTSDSVTVVVNQPSYTTETIVACGSYEWHGTTYTSSTNNTGGIFGAGAGSLPTWTGTNAAGCDSIVSLDLTITPFTVNTTTIAACDSYTWPVNGQTYTASGTHIVNAGETVFFNSLSGLTSAVASAGYTLSATETFESYSSGPQGTLTGSFGQGSLSWTASATPGGSYTQPSGGSMALSTNSAVPLTISFNPGVTSVGANFFVTGYVAQGPDVFPTLSGTITLTLSDGSSQSFYTNTANSFGGFVSHGAFISSITIATSNDYVTVDNLVVSTGTINACISEELNLTINHPSTTTETIVACGSYNWHGNTYTSSNNTDTWTGTNAAGCDSIVSLDLTIQNPSTAPTSITSSVAFATAGVNFTLSVNGGSLGTGATWQWYTGSCGGTLIGTGASISVSQNANTTYFVRAEGTCNTTDCATITVESFCGATGVTSSAGKTAICAGSPVTLTVIGSLSPGAQWRWDDECENDDDDNDCSYNTSSTFTVSPNTTKTYYVRSVGGACGLTACVPVTVNVIAKPATPGTISGSASVCPSTSVTYTIAAVAGATSYTWTAPTNATLVSAQGGTSMTVAYAGTFTSGTLKVKANNCSGSSSDRTKSIAKQAAPATPASISGAAAPCKNSTQTYSIAAVTGATSYTWALPTGVSFVSGTPQTGTSIQVVVASTFSSGTLSVKANNCGGSSSNRTKALTGQSAPTAPGTITGPSSVTQNTANNTFSVSNVAGMTYNWTVPAGCTITLGQGTSTIKVTWGTVAGTVSVTRNNGCGNSVASTKSVSVKRSEEAEADAGIESARTEETVETLLTQTDALNAIAVYPNPTTGEARITFSANASGQYEISIVDLQGRVINSTSGAAIEGNNTVDINLSNCSNGVYMIHLMHNDTLQTLRVVKM